jgi:hypothetical protein
MDGMPIIVAVKNHLGEMISETDAWHTYSREPHGGVFDFWGKKVTHWMPLPAPPAEESK